MSENVKNPQAVTAPVESDNPFANQIDPKTTIFLGLLEKAGEFTDDNGKNVPFHNVLVSVADVPETNSYTLKCYGFEAVVLKIKFENILSVFGFDDFAEFIPTDWIGKQIDIRYDKKGNVKSIVRL